MFTMEFLVTILVALIFSLGTGAIIAVIAFPVFIFLEKVTIKIFSKKYENKIDGIFFTVFITMLIIVVLWHTAYTAIPSYMIKQMPWEEVNYTTHSIINLADNNEIEGQFRGRYVRGYIGEETVYHYYYETADGGMKLQKANEKNTTIYPTEEISPCAKWYRCTRSLWWLKEEEYYCKIYVPEGTVTTEFVIDME